VRIRAATEDQLFVSRLNVVLGPVVVNSDRCTWFRDDGMTKILRFRAAPSPVWTPSSADGLPLQPTRVDYPPSVPGCFWRPTETLRSVRV